MKTIVISYSLTGNNEALAISIASKFAAEHIKITESKTRTVLTIILDILLNRIPRSNPSAAAVADKVRGNTLVLFVGPVWLGHVATPLRAYFKYFKDVLGQYAFISISGGALGPNKKLAGELKKMVGKDPVAVINLYIADLLPPNPKPTSKDTQAYRLSRSDVERLTSTIMQTLRPTKN
ncbi:MAG TPA: hypothetical protein VLH19_01800 [Patescibacteria group bacterium]|nr:hypothetical protein [Patescibacteria group bacterium]